MVAVCHSHSKVLTNDTPFYTYLNTVVMVTHYVHKSTITDQSEVRLHLQYHVYLSEQPITDLRTNDFLCDSKA